MASLSAIIAQVEASGMALTADVLVNDALVVSPGPPAWLAVKASKTGEF